VHHTPIDTLYTWACDQSGFIDGHDITWDIPKGWAILHPIPVWLTIVDATGWPISDHGVVYDGGLIRIFPTFDNAGGELTGLFTLTDIVGNTSTIDVVHQAAPLAVVVNITITGAAFTISNVYYNAPLYYDQLYIRFDHTYSGQEYFYIRVSDVGSYELYAGSGFGSGILVKAGDQTVMNMTLNRNLAPGDILSVVIGGEDNNVNADLQYLTIAPLAPTIEIAYVRANADSFTWLAGEYGLIDSETVIFDCPIGATVTTKASWLSVIDSDANTLSVGSFVADDKVLTIFPTSPNTDLVAKTGTLALTDARGNTDFVTVTQSANLTPPVVNVLETTPPPLIITNNGCTGVNGSADITINFTPNSPDRVWGESYLVNYIILKNGGNVGSGTFTVNEEVNNNKVLTMGSVAVGGDIIDVYLQFNG
jgi:hypothetical protein